MTSAWKKFNPKRKENVAIAIPILTSLLDKFPSYPKETSSYPKCNPKIKWLKRNVAIVIAISTCSLYKFPSYPKKNLNKVIQSSKIEWLWFLD